MDDKFKMGTVVFDHWRIVRMLRASTSGNLYQLLYHDHGRDYRAMLKVVSVPKNLKELVSIQGGAANYNQYFNSVLSFMLEEVEIMARLGGNPYVVNYYDHKVERHPSGLGYDLMIRMEQLPNLTEYAISTQLTRGDVLRLGIDLCKALEECHEKSIIHRNIRPEHIYVTSTGSFKLGDFGLPCVSSKDITLEEKNHGEFMAPELFRDEEYDHRVDAYSLGLVLYILLNQGKLPFYPDSITDWDKEESRARRMRGEVLPLPPAIRWSKLGKIIGKATHFEPRMRYQAVRELRKDLESVSIKKEDKIIVFPLEQATTPPDPFNKNQTMDLIASWFGMF